MKTVPEKTQLLVLGLGNVLCSDDGLGATAVHLLDRAYIAPEGVRIVDGGTLGLSLLPLLQDAQRVLIVDAIRNGGAGPGSPVRIEGEDVAPAVRERLSPHQIGVADLVDGARLLGCCPPTMVLVGLVPESLALGVELSPAVARGMTGLVKRVAAEARALGYEFRPRSCDDKSAHLADDDSFARAFGLQRPER